MLNVEFKNMDSKARINWAMGEIVLGIGSNDLRSAVWMIMSTCMSDGYERGQLAGVEMEKRRQKEKALNDRMAPITKKRKKSRTSS